MNSYFEHYLTFRSAIDNLQFNISCVNTQVWKPPITCIDAQLVDDDKNMILTYNWQYGLHTDVTTLMF
jgi:hypothetical protein